MAILKNILKEPVGWLALAATIILHFVPGYTELKEIWEEDRQHISLNCSEPNPDEAMFLDGSEPSIGFPITCRLNNNTEASISIDKYGPVLIDRRRFGALLFREDWRRGIIPRISDRLPEAVLAQNAELPLLLQPREILKYESVFAVPATTFAAASDEDCVPANEIDLSVWRGHVCIGDKPIHFTNYLYTPLSVGFWDWDSYGQMVSLGDGRDVFFSEELFLFSADCSAEDAKIRVPTCFEETTRFLPASSWVVGEE